MVIFLAFRPEPAQGFEPRLTGELSAGYDSNVALAEDSPGAGFLLAALGFETPLNFSGHLEPLVYVEGAYRLYRQVEDNYRLAAGFRFSRPFQEGELIPFLSAEAAVYRDGFVTADERNEGRLTLGLQWHASEPVFIDLNVASYWFDYLNPSAPYAGRGPSNPSNGLPVSRSMGTSAAPVQAIPGRGRRNHKGNRNPRKILPARDDRETAVDIGLTRILTPAVTFALFAEGSRVNSSIETESYDSLRSGAMIDWALSPDWGISAGLDWTKARYSEAAPDTSGEADVRRIDHALTAYLSLSRQWSTRTLFWRVQWSNNDSTLPCESYRRGMTECGVSFSF